MRRYWVYKNDRFVGGVEVDTDRADRIRAAGFRLLPA